MEERQKRKGIYKVDIEFESILKELNKSLRSLETEMVNKSDANNLPPLIFFSFAPRTGSTMVSQVMARTGEFAYISNFVARFWDAPLLALQIEKKTGLGNSYFGMPLLDVESKYGVTSNVSDPHEFGFFWNKLLTSKFNTFIDINELDEVLIQFLRKEVNAMRSVYDKPFFFKNGIAGYNTACIRKIFPDAWFLKIERSPEFVAQSIYKARVDLYSNPKEWWSLKPKDYEDIVRNSESEYEEIAYQIKSGYRDINEGLEGNEERVVKIKYEEFCSAPKEHIDKIFNKIGWTPSDRYKNLMIERRPVRKERIVDQDIFDSIKMAVNKIILRIN